MKNKFHVRSRYLNDNFGLWDFNFLNVFGLDKNLSFSFQEKPHKEIDFLSKKTYRKNNDIEKDNNFEDQKGEINPIEGRRENNEDKLLSYENLGYNGNISEEKEIDRIEIKKEGENSENDRKIKNLKKNEGKKKMFKIIKVRKEGIEEKYTQYGRKRQEDKNKGKNGDHNRDSEDNKMRKIKSFFGKNLYLFINDSFSDKTNEFLKLEISINKNLKKDFNEQLFKMKIKDIYYNYEISDKYVHFDKDTNRNLIKKIYKEKKETNVIKILDLTYIEAFDIFRRKIKAEKDIKPELKSKINGNDFLKKFKDFDCFIKKIRHEEKGYNNNEDFEEYIKDIKRLCIEFEDWFEKKIGRTRKDNAKKED